MDSEEHEYNKLDSQEVVYGKASLYVKKIPKITKINIQSLNKFIYNPSLSSKRLPFLSERGAIKNINIKFKKEEKNHFKLEKEQNKHKFIHSTHKVF